jgi:hypothetical protein
MCEICADSNRWWGCKTSEMWRYVDGRVIPDVSKDHNVLTFRGQAAQREFSFDCLTLMMKIAPPSETSRTPRQTTQRHIPSLCQDRQTDTNLNLYRRALEGVVQHGQYFGPDVVTRGLLQNDVQTLQQRDCRLDRLRDREHVPGTQERNIQTRTQ